MTSLLEAIALAMAKGRVNDIKINISDAIEQGANPLDILNNALIATMEGIGEKFSRNQVFIPEVMMAARAMNEGMHILKPYLVSMGNEPIGEVIICTVKGDSHDIGKNLVKIMLEGVGIEVLDLGANVPTEKIIQAVIDNSIKVVCLSALLTTTMPMLKDVINKLILADLRETVKVIVGGAPVTQAYADSIGADGYADDAASAAKLVKGLFSK